MSAVFRARLSDLWGGELVPCKVGDDAVFLVRIVASGQPGSARPSGDIVAGGQPGSARPSGDIVASGQPGSGNCDAVRAYRDKCPHQGVPLSEGRLDGTTLTCRAHLHTYDVVSGLGLNPAGVELVPYRVCIAGDDVTVTGGPE